MRKALLAAACFTLFASPIYAQTPVLNPVTPLTGTAGPNGSATPVSPSNPLPISGSFSATLTGFTPNGLYASLTATATTSASTAIPTGSTTVRITNLGAGTVSCTFATGAATGLVNNTQVGPSSSVSRAVGAFDHLACIDQTGSSGSQLVIIEGGAGLGNDTGGGGGGGGGGTVTQGPTGTNAAAWWTQIGDTTNGPVAVVTAGANGASNTASGLLSYGRNLVFNGTTWDRWTGAVTLASGAVASGAYVAGSFAAGAGVDGWDVTKGSKTDAPASVPTSTTSASEIALLKAIANTGQYPAGATAVTASATGTTGATTATLAGVASKTMYVCSYSIRANATANANVQNTITGLISGTRTDQMWVPANTAGLGVDEQIFTPCIPASAVNTSIAVASGAPGTGGNVTVNVAGYYY